jgi:hypothetical protein
VSPGSFQIRRVSPESVRSMKPAAWRQQCPISCATVNRNRDAHALPLFLLRKMLSEVTSGPQQLNREAHPRDNQARFRRERRPRNCASDGLRICLIGSTRGFAHKLMRLDHGITAFDSRRRTLVTGHAWNELIGLVLEWNNRG